MDRLTIRFDADNIGVSGDDGMYYSHDLPHICEAINRLAEYEDTGLAPGEINLSAVMLDTFIVYSRLHGRTLSWLEDIVKAEADGRLIVLPCGDDVKLEYKGLTYKADHWNPPVLTAFANCPTSPSGEKVHLFSPEEAKAAIVKESYQK